MVATPPSLWMFRCRTPGVGSSLVCDPPPPPPPARTRGHMSNTRTGAADSWGGSPKKVEWNRGIGHVFLSLLFCAVGGMHNPRVAAAGHPTAGHRLIPDKGYGSSIRPPTPKRPPTTYTAQHTAPVFYTSVPMSGVTF